MWFTGYFLLATSTFCVAHGFVPNQIPAAIHKLGLKPAPYIFNSDESDDTIVTHQTGSTVRSGSSSVSFNNGFDDVGYSKKSFSTKTSSSSIQIEADSDDFDSVQDFVEDIGDDAILSTTNRSASGLIQSMSDLDILSGRSMGERNLQEDILMDNNEMISDMISSTMEEDIILPSVSDQINMVDMEDIIEEIAETTDTMTLTEIEENLETSNLINNGPILPMQNSPSFAGYPPSMGGVLPPNMMKSKIPGSMINSVTPSQMNMNHLPTQIPSSITKPHQSYPSITPPLKPLIKPQQLHPTGYIPPVTDLNSPQKPISLPPGMVKQYNKPMSHLPEIPAIPPYGMPTLPTKKPYKPYPLLPPSSSTLPPMKMLGTPYQFLPPSISTPPMMKPYGTYQQSSPSFMPMPLPKQRSMMPFGGYPRTPRANPFLSPQMSYLPTTASETIVDLEDTMETWSSMNGLNSKLPWPNYYDMPGKNMPGLNGPGLNMPGLNTPGLTTPELTIPGLNTPGFITPGLNMPGLNTPRLNTPGLTIPELTTPGLNMPGLNTPRSTTPGLNMPRLTTSGLNKPRLNMPGLNVPELTIPGLNMPGLNTPGLNMPKLTTPGLNMPGLNKPRLNMPGLNVPELTTPGLNMPGLNKPGLNIPGMTIPGKNLPGLNAPPYMRRFPSNTLDNIDEISEYYFDTINYDSLNGPYMQDMPLDYSYSQFDELDFNQGLEYPYDTQPKKYPISLNTRMYPPGSQEYPYITPRYPRQNLGTPFWPYFGTPQIPPYQKPLLTPTSHPYLPLNKPNLPYYSFPKPKIPIPVNQPNLTPWNQPKIPTGITPGNYPHPLYPPKLPTPEIIPGTYPKPLYPPKFPSPGIIPGSYPKPLHPPIVPPSIIPGNYPPVHPLSVISPLDISYLIDESPQLYSQFDALFIYSSPAALIAAKELSDAGKRVLLTSGGSFPPPESYSLYLRPQILTQPNYVKSGPINIPGAFSPKTFFYPTFLGGLSEIGLNNWDYGTRHKNQQWSNISPSWNWKNIAQLYDAVELTPGEIDAEGIVPVNRNLPRTQTIDYISSALQELGLSDLGTEYSLRDQPGSMMLPVMAEEGAAGLKPVVFAEEVLEDMNNPENVFLCLNTQIEKMDVLGDRVVGVTIKTPSGQKYSIDAEDVIMGGNPTRIAQLLYKSGLGDEKVLDQLQIPTHKHLPAVGKHWTVNPMFTGSFFTLPQGTLNEFGTSDVEATEEFLQGQYGIQSGILLDQFKAFISIQDGLESNVTINFYAFTISMIERLNALMEGLFQFDEATQIYMRDLLQTNDILFALPQLMDTKSQGKIIINSKSDLKFPPNLDSGMYSNPQDMSVMLEALQFVESLGETPTFQMLGANYMQISIDACLGYKSFERYNECLIHNLSVPGLYSSGGAIMGTSSLNSVVNSNLQVHGMENLYVMNPSVIPNGTGAESVATDSLIGEYGANFILRKNSLYL